MTTLRGGLDIAVDVFTSALWGLAAFFLGARIISPSAGLVLGLAVFITTMTFVVTSRVQERRARAIAAGVCPRCATLLATEHEHRRWDTAHQAWLAPLTTWRCNTCAFQQEAALACDACPA